MDKIFSPIKSRLIKYIENQSISKEKFFLDTGISPSNFKGKGSISEIGGDKIVKILSTYPQINPTWLLTGTGNMLLTGAEATAKEQNKPQQTSICASCIGKDTRITDLEKTISLQEKLIQSLEREIDHLKDHK